MIVGAALAVAASALLPIAKSTLKPLAQSGLQGAMGLVNRAKYALQVAREEVEDIIAEAQFERMKKQIDQEIASLEPEADTL
jgi:exonuclease VII small subunit